MHDHFQSVNYTYYILSVPLEMLVVVAAFIIIVVSSMIVTGQEISSDLCTCIIGTSQ
jgi:hypothetical protein